jgi:hypothetical protein
MITVPDSNQSSCYEFAILLCKITYSRAPPRVSIIDYLRRVANYTSLTPPFLLSVVLYMDQLCSLYSEFIVSTLRVHHFLITAATVASNLTSTGLIRFMQKLAG